MSDTPTPSEARLHLGRMLAIFAVLSVVFVAALAIAPAKSYFSEWRAHQNHYNRLAVLSGLAPIDVQIQQIWNPELGAVDRCVSCHLAEAGFPPIKEEQLFAPHPPVPHDPGEFGCTGCHGGQGRATSKADAHGEVAHWSSPLLRREHFEAGCGSCHSGLSVGALERVEHGERLFERYDCLACHRVEGRGGTPIAPLTLPDLSGIGARGVPANWHDRHLEQLAANPEGVFRERYGEIPDEHVALINDYLGTLVASPDLAAGKRLFHALGCRGCHKIDGVGGEDGLDLTLIGLRPLEEILFPSDWEHEKSASAWHVEHLLSPASVVRDSKMPDLGLTRQQAESLALYLLSLRKSDVPAAYWPADRLRVEKLGEREFASDGRTLFLVFCSACHGHNGEGHRYGELAQAFPGIINPAFLAVASDDFLVQTITSGRPGNRMPAWGEMEGGLRRGEIESLVRYLRSQEPTPPSFEDVQRSRRDLALGARTYSEECATCHGRRGEGAIGPSLRSPVLHFLAGDRFLYDTLVEGRPGTAMPRHRSFDAVTLASVLAFLRSLCGEAAPPVDLRAVVLPEGSAAAGQNAYRLSCAACHGENGEGGAGPAIGKQGFLRVASDAYVVEAYSRGRCRDERGEGAAIVERSVLADIAAYLRAEAARPGLRLEGRRVKADREAGARLFARHCAGCHGERGEGKEALALANPAFLGAANDSYLQAMIARGRHATSMPRFDRDQPAFPRLSAAEINDIVTFIRSLESVPSRGNP
ncbi:MAG: c-type cytochrome [Planctomycetota bacterium]